MSVLFTRHPQLPPLWPGDRLAPPYTWDYADVPARYRHHEVFKHDLVHCTCPNRHTLRLVDTVHSIADDGTVSPSYVCTSSGCSFHAYVRLLGYETRRRT